MHLAPNPPSALLRRLAVAAACACATAAAAQADEPIATDRPDFVESSAVVGRGRVQIEASLAGERDVDAAGTRVSARATPTLVRIGVNERTELRLETDGRSRVHVQDATGGTVRERGFADVSLGVKWHQQDNEGARPALAWLARLDLDTGSAAFRGNGVRPSLRMVAEWELPRDFSAGVMPGLFVDRDDDGERFVGGILAAVVGYAWTPRLRTFVEVAAEQIARSRHGGSVVALDLGAAFLLTPSVQVDAAVSHGLNDNAADRAWTLGLSVRF